MPLVSVPRRAGGPLRVCEGTALVCKATAVACEGRKAVAGR